MDQNFKSLTQTNQNLQFNNSQKNNEQTENVLINEQQQNQVKVNDNIQKFECSNKKGSEHENKNEIMNKQANEQEDKNNMQDENFVELGYFEENDFCTKRNRTQRKGKGDNIQKNEQEQEQLEDIQINIYKNAQSIVDLKFDANQMKFIVQKQNLNDTGLFEKEYQKLEILKGSNVTLDIISPMKDNKTFQQIAGKTNLEFALLKKIGKLTLTTYFFILLDKLNKMHEIGIAHSDIKPQNIVLSFDNEPFFIDFGASIILSDNSDYKNYLQYLTRKYNLQIYSENNSKQFESKEEIKLCDKVQLSLTFLFLYCDYRQQKLFNQKKINQLLQDISQQLNQRKDNLINSEYNDHENQYVQYQIQKSGKIFLFNISRILNQADPEINIIEDKVDQIFEVNEQILNDEQKNLNDITFQNSENIYIVQRIDKYSILFIYFLDKQGHRLKIDPEKAYITPLPEMKEYNYISEKYKIDEYFQQLKNQIITPELSENQRFNIFQNIIINKNRNIIVSGILVYIGFFSTLKRLNLQQSTFEIKIQWPNEMILFSKMFLQQPFYQKCVKSFEVSRDILIMNIKIDVNQNIQINQEPEVSWVDVVVHLQNIDYSFIRDIDFIKSLYKVQKLEFYFKNKQVKNIQESKQLENLQLNQQIKQDYQNDRYPQQIEFENSINYILHKYNILHDYDILHKNDILHKQGILKIYKKVVIIKIYDQTFEQMYIWLLILKMLQIDSNFNIEIITINCLFSKPVVLIFKQIQQLYSNKVSYEFEEEKIENNDLKYSIKVEYSLQELNQQKLKIIFLQKKEEVKKISNQDYGKLEITEKDNISSFQDNKKIKQMFSQNKYYNIAGLNELKLEYEQQIFIQKFKFFDKQIKIKFIDDLDLSQKIKFIIKNIQSKVNYSGIQYYSKYLKEYSYTFSERYQQHLNFNFKCINDDILNQYYQLNLSISNNYNINEYLNKCGIQNCLEFKYLKIDQEIKYLDLNDQNNYKDIFAFFRQNKNSNSNYENHSEKQKFLLLEYRIKKLNQFEQDNDKFANVLIDSFDKFQKHSYINLLLRNEKIQNKCLLYQINVDMEIFEETHNYFKIFFNQIEKFIPQDKIYVFINENNKKSSKDQIKKQQILDYIQEVINTYSLQQQLHFDLFNYEYEYEEIKQFIIKFNELNNNQFIFIIDNHNLKDTESLFMNDFSDNMEFNLDKFLIIKLKEKSFNSKITQATQIQFFFKLKYKKQIIVTNEELSYEDNIRISQQIVFDDYYIFKSTQKKYQQEIQKKIQQDEINKLNIYQQKESNDQDEINLKVNEQLLDYLKIKEFIESEIQVQNLFSEPNFQFDFQSYLNQRSVFK